MRRFIRLGDRTSHGGVKATMGGASQVTHCALYDTVEGQWRFAGIKGLR